MIDVDALLARTDLSVVAGHFTPLVKRGREYVGRCIAHKPDNHPSMYIYQKDGCWQAKCFSCGWAGDAIAFIMEVEGIDFLTACARLGATDDWQPTITTPLVPKRPDRVTGKPPLGEPAPDMTLRKLGRPSKTWAYRDSDGTILGYVCRYDSDEGKEIRCWTWGSVGDEPPRWAVGQWNRPRPLYGLDRLAARPTAPVLVTEGEKAADAAARLLTGMVAVTWPGGAHGVHHAEWEPLRGRKVLLWPDNDDPGRKAMQQLAGVLASHPGLACKVRLVDPSGQPDGWDISDAETEGWTAQAVKDWALARISDYEPVGVKTPDTAQDALPTTESGAEPTPATDTPKPPLVAPRSKPRKAKPVLSLVGGSAAAQALDPDPLPLALSEVGIAAEFVALHKDDFRYVADWKRWVVWNGERWELENKKRVEPLARLTVLCNSLKHRAEAAALSASAKAKLESRPYIYSVMELAECAREFQAKPSDFDADPWLLGTPGGTVDLREGKLIAAEREHMLIRRVTVTPQAGPSPLFDRVLHCATGGNPEMLAYLWRWLGYILTGDVREECFLFLYGKPQSGKTTLIEAIAGILGKIQDGGYAALVDMDMLCESRIDKGNDRIIALQAARFAYASETEEGRHWKPSLLKWITGGDSLQGRRLYEEAASFAPTHKLCVFGNNKPHLRSADDGIRRRLHLLEYHGAISDAERDNTLKPRLIAEYPAILARMIDGCLDWQRCNGLKKPAEITSNVETYFESEDTLGAWLEDKTVRDLAFFMLSGEAYHSYSDYVTDRGERPPTQKRFSMMMQAHGFTLSRKATGRAFDGARLKTVHDTPMPPLPDDPF